MALTKIKNQKNLIFFSGNAVVIGLALGATSLFAQNKAPEKNQLSSSDVIVQASAEHPDTSEQVCEDEAVSDSWLDRSYSYLNERLCAPAVWFDGFFGDPRSLEENPVNSFIRVRSALGWDQGGGADAGLQVRANLVLPRLSDRVRLLVAKDEDVSGDGLSALGLDDDNNNTRLGLRFIVGDGLTGLSDLDATIRVKSGSLNPRLSSRYRIARPVGETAVIRGTQTVFWEHVEGWGTQSRVDLEWVPRPDRLVRWTTRGTLSEASSGVDWRSLFLVYQQLDRKTALRLDAGAEGDTRPKAVVDEYFVALRLRRQFLRPWLFFEVQPERAWPRDALTSKRRGDWRLALTLEVQFENAPAGHSRRWNIQR